MCKGPSGDSNRRGPAAKKMEGIMTIPAKNGMPSQTRFTKKSNGTLLAMRHQDRRVQRTAPTGIAQAGRHYSHKEHHEFGTWVESLAASRLCGRAPL